MRPPRNTSREAEENPAGFLLESMIAGPSEAIEAQEARGQADFTDSDTLPTDYGHRGEDVPAVLEAAGVCFGEVVEGDPLFQYVALPKGWQKRPTDHAMWSDLLNEKGRKRASIFYKAAFYDRKAHIHLCCRYGIQINYPEDFSAGGKVNVEVRDGDETLYETEGVMVGPSGDGSRYDAIDKEADAAHAWLNKHYPDWQNPAAYWD